MSIISKMFLKSNKKIHLLILKKISYIYLKENIQSRGIINVLQ